MSGYDRERVQDIVAGTLRKLTALDEPEDMTAAETATDIAAGFLPGVGTAQAMRDFERARRKKDKLGMAMAAASGVPVAGGVVKPVAKMSGKLKQAVEQGAAILPKYTQDEAIAALEGSQKANLQYQPLLENLHQFYRAENPKVASSIERMYDDLERKVDPDAAARAFSAGYTQPGARVSYSKDIGARSPQAWTPGLHVASPGNEGQLGPLIERYFGERTLPKRALAPVARPVLARAERAIQLPDIAFENPDVLAAQLGLTDELRAALSKLPAGVEPTNQQKSAIMTRILERKGIDVGAYINEVEGTLGPGNVSFTSFGKDKIKGFADGGPALPADRATGYRAPGQRPDDRAARFGSSFLKSLPGAAQGVATGYVDMLSALNTYLYQLEPAEQIALLKQLPEGLRNMVLRGVESVKQLPAKVAAATPESAGQFGAQLTAEMLLDPTRGVGKTVPTTQVIKPKGGNWPAGAVESVVGNLKTPKRVPALTMGDELRIDASLLMRPEQLVENYQKELNKIDLDDPRSQDMAYQLQQEIESETRNAALDTWLDQKLAKYVKNELASPDDPIRKQIDEFAGKKKQMLEQKDQQISKAMLDLEKARAERGFTPEMLTRSQARIRELRRERDYINKQSGAHMTPRPLDLAQRWVPELVADRRKDFGFDPEGMAKSELGKGWENMADLSITPQMAGNILNRRVYSMIENNPWLTKVPPETMVYQPDLGLGGFNDLDFGHMRDELRNALDPESDLPDALKITPDKLKMLNMAQASKLVDDINAFRATRATEVNAARAGNIATVPVKEYPEQGLKWVELKMPEPEIEPGHGPGPVSGYPSLHGIIDQKTGQSVSAGATPEEARNLYKREERKKALEDALKYEGEMLKHCVGGYCEDVVQGRSRIFSLRDDDGRPRVTIEVQPNSGQKMTFEQAKRAIEDDPLTANLDDNVKMEMLYNQGFLDEEGNVLPDLPMQIIQVKGAGNKKPQPEDIPLVQDFIRSGKYEIAGDERNTGFVKLPKDNMMIAALKRTGNKPPALRSEAGDYFLTEDEHKRLSEWFDKGTAQGFLAPEFAHGGAVKMAAGGKVGYNPAVVDEIVNRVREKLNG